MSRFGPRWWEGFTVHWYDVFLSPVYFIRKGLYDSVKMLAPELKGKLLDFGCGSKPYKKLFVNSTSYIGLDIEVSGHPHSNEQIDVFYDGKVIPFEDGSFDNVFSTEVFEHVFNLDDVIPEIRRVLREDGYLLITCPFAWREHEQPYDFARYSSFGIKHILEKHGFVIEQQLKTGNYIVTLSQLILFLLYCYTPKRPQILYLILHQILMLPIILVTVFLNAVLPKRVKRNDLYLNNVVLARKVTPVS